MKFAKYWEPVDGFTLSSQEDAVIGKTPVSAHVLRDRDRDGYDEGDEIRIAFSDGSYCRWYHSNDCCESVSIVDINGDLNDLIGHPILVADVRTSERDMPQIGHETWTFYTIRSVGGSVDIRWHGESNGYYSESVDFQLMTPIKE